MDSVATETGKLLSGLADSGNKKSRRGEGLEGEEGEEVGEGEGAADCGECGVRRGDVVVPGDEAGE